LARVLLDSTVEEIWRWLRPVEEAAAKRMFRGLRLAPLGVAEGARAGTWRRQYAVQGVTLHQADCLIAAASVGIGATLATANVDDYPMPELIVENWPVGQ
jgi:predicted nucleic acid-binding protein